MQNGNPQEIRRKKICTSLTKANSFHIEVDITGITDLRIEMYGAGNISLLGIDSVLVDVMLQKK